MDAQAGLRLCCSQTPEDRFSRGPNNLSRHATSHYDYNAHAWSMDVFLVFEFTEEENIYLKYDFGLGSDKTYEQNVSLC